MNECFWALASTVEGLRYRYLVGDGSPVRSRRNRGVASDITGRSAGGSSRCSTRTHADEKATGPVTAHRRARLLGTSRAGAAEPRPGPHGATTSRTSTARRTRPGRARCRSSRVTRRRSRFEPCAMEGTFAKYSALHPHPPGAVLRPAGRPAIAAKDPAVAVISNVPLLAHCGAGPPAHAAAACRWCSGTRTSTRRPSASAAPAPSPAASGALIARLADRVERTDRPPQRGGRGDLADVPRAARPTGASPTRSTVVPNWAPIDELPVRDADNEWRRHGWACAGTRSCCTRARSA